MPGGVHKKEAPRPARSRKIMIGEVASIVGEFLRSDGNDIPVTKFSLRITATRKGQPSILMKDPSDETQIEYIHITNCDPQGNILNSKFIDQSNEQPAEESAEESAGESAGEPDVEPPVEPPVQHPVQPPVQPPVQSPVAKSSFRRAVRRAIQCGLQPEISHDVSSMITNQMLYINGKHVSFDNLENFIRYCMDNLVPSPGEYVLIKICQVYAKQLLCDMVRWFHDNQIMCLIELHHNGKMLIRMGTTISSDVTCLTNIIRSTYIYLPVKLTIDQSLDHQEVRLETREMNMTYNLTSDGPSSIARHQTNQVPYDSSATLIISEVTNFNISSAAILWFISVTSVKNTRLKLVIGHGDNIVFNNMVTFDNYEAAVRALYSLIA